jgi:hypothetical protein
MTGKGRTRSEEKIHKKSQENRKGIQRGEKEKGKDKEERLNVT